MGQRARRVTTLDGLMRQDYSKLVSFLSARLGNSSDAEDIAQETFVKLAELLSNGEEIRQPRALMFSIARNLCLDLLRRNVRTRKIFADVQEDDVKAISALDDDRRFNPEACFEDRQLAQMVDTSIKPLSPRCQNVFRLTKIDGRTYPETAREMNLSISMIEKYISRSLRQIRNDPAIISAFAA